MGFFDKFKKQEKPAETPQPAPQAQQPRQQPEPEPKQQASTPKGEKVYYAFIAKGQGGGVESMGFSGGVVLEADQARIEEFLKGKYPAFADAPVKCVTKEDGWKVPYIGGVRADGVDTDFQMVFGSIAMYLAEEEGIDMDCIAAGYQIAMQQPLVFPNPVTGKLIIGFPVVR